MAADANLLPTPPSDDADDITLEGSPFSSVVLHDISWKMYRKLRKNHESRNIFMTYDCGELEIMAPFLRHEQIASVLASLITIWALELNVPFASLRKTTLRRSDFRRGFEPDASYYVQHEPQMWNKRKIDFKTDPPPDLAVEVAICEKLLDRRRLYAAFRVPELWCWHGHELKVHELTSDGSYIPRDTSICFPRFPIAMAQEIMRRLGVEHETTLVRSFRDWVRDNAQPAG